MSVLNLGAGLAAFVGPLIVALFRNAIGYVGIVWFMAGLYIFERRDDLLHRAAQSVAAKRSA